MSEAQMQRLQTSPVTLRSGNRSGKITDWAIGRRFLPAFLAALMFVVFAFAFVWSNYQSVRIGYSIADLNHEWVRLNELGRELRVELANLTALDRLEHVSKNELGLVAPQPDQVKVIE